MPFDGDGSFAFAPGDGYTLTQNDQVSGYYQPDSSWTLTVNEDYTITATVTESGAARTPGVTVSGGGFQLWNRIIVVVPLTPVVVRKQWKAGTGVTAQELNAQKKTVTFRVYGITYDGTRSDALDLHASAALNSAPVSNTLTAANQSASDADLWEKTVYVPQVQDDNYYVSYEVEEDDIGSDSGWDTAYTNERRYITSFGESGNWQEVPDEGGEWACLKMTYNVTDANTYKNVNGMVLIFKDQNHGDIIYRSTTGFGGETGDFVTHGATYYIKVRVPKQSGGYNLAFVHQNGTFTTMDDDDTVGYYGLCAHICGTSDMWPSVTNLSADPNQTIGSMNTYTVELIDLDNVPSGQKVYGSSFDLEVYGHPKLTIENTYSLPPLTELVVQKNWQTSGHDEQKQTVHFTVNGVKADGSRVQMPVYSADTRTSAGGASNLISDPTVSSTDSYIYDQQNGSTLEWAREIYVPQYLYTEGDIESFEVVEDEEALNVIKLDSDTVIGVPGRWETEVSSGQATESVIIDPGEEAKNNEPTGGTNTAYLTFRASLDNGNWGNLTHIALDSVTISYTYGARTYTNVITISNTYGYTYNIIGLRSGYTTNSTKINNGSNYSVALYTEIQDISAITVTGITGHIHYYDVINGWEEEDSQVRNCV